MGAGDAFGGFWGGGRWVILGALELIFRVGSGLDKVERGSACVSGGFLRVGFRGVC